MKKPILAIMYDFDKTLSTSDMQNYSFIPSLGISTDEFWARTTKFTNDNGVERVLSYMYTMLEIAKEKNIKVTREFLNKCGQEVGFFPGVESWFKRLNDYAKKKGVILEHYCVSCGTYEILEGTSIFKEFKKAFGCEYFYKNNEPIWPKLTINYTQKTQFFYRIAKGVFDVTNDNSVNEKTKNLRIPYTNIVVMGDGMTDIAVMTLAKKSGGRSIAVYPEKSSEKVKQIYTDGRVNFMCQADYREGSDLDKVLKLIIDLTSTTAQMGLQEKELAKK